MAMDRDTTAMRLCLERICPPRKDHPVQFEIPEMKTAMDATRALDSILTAVSTGDLTPMQASSLASLIEGYRKTLETAELERRIAALEEKQ